MYDDLLFYPSPKSELRNLEYIVVSVGEERRVWTVVTWPAYRNKFGIKIDAPIGAVSRVLSCV